MNNIKNDILSAWSSVHGCLEKKLPGHAIHAWFDPIVPIGFRNNSFLLEVPNQFFLEWIESHYKEDLFKALEDTYGEKIKYKFLISKDKGQKNIEKPTQNLDVETKTRNFNNLNLKYTFKNFIVGSNNEFAKTASESVANNPGEHNFNPLIIYGGVGLGKTHLMHAIGNQALENNNDLNIVNITSEQFTLDFVNSLRKNKTIEFAQNYRSSDILLIDDIQFMNGKEAMQEEFFHTFNALLDKGSQIIVSADRSPNKLSRIQERIKSRFSGGLVVDIQKPEYELRKKIVQNKVKELEGLYSEQFKISQEIIDFISKEITASIRELVGAINRIASFSRIYNKLPNFSETKVILKDLLNLNENKVTIDLIQTAVCKFFKISKNEMLSSRRSRYLVRPRQTAIYLTKILTSKSLPEIGREFSNRDHTTIIHSVKTIEKLKENDVSIVENINKLKNQILYNNKEK